MLNPPRKAGVTRALAAITALLVVMLMAAGCSLVRPGGATLVKYDPTVCVSGYVTLAECYAAPTVELPDDTAESVNLAVTLAKAFFGLPVAELDACAVAGAVKVDGPVIVATGVVECVIGGTLKQQVVEVTLKPAA